MKVKTISIIGGTGNMGSIFVNALKEKGYDVISSSRSTQIQPKEAASKADIVIITVPIEVTEKVINDISKSLKKDALLVDFTSVKVMPCNAMKKAFAGEIIGAHPLFGPGLKPNGQSMVLCPVRKGSRYETFKNLMLSLDLKIVEMTPQEHDKEFAIIQCLNHFTNISFAKFLNDEHFNLNSKLMTPALKLKLSVVGRMLSQEDSLYPNILTYNPYSAEIIKKYEKSEKKIIKSVEKKEREELIDMVKSLKNYFGEHSSESRELTNKILEKLNGK